MKRIFTYFPVAAALLLAASCNLLDSSAQEEVQYGTLSLRIDAPMAGTRTAYTDVDEQDEGLSSALHLFIFDKTSRKLEWYEWVAADEFVRDVYIPQGRKYVWIVSRMPNDDAQGIVDHDTYVNYTFQLSDNCNGDELTLQWEGGAEVDVAGGETVNLIIHLNRIAARVVLRSFVNNLPSGSDITVNRVWLSNVAGDWTVADSPSPYDINSWYNIQGRSDRAESHIIDGSSYTADLPALTYRSVGETVSYGETFPASSSSYLRLYCFPNPSTTTPNGYTSSFSDEYTTLVVDTTIDGVTHYFSVPINQITDGHTRPIESDFSYTVDMTVGGPGSPDPNDPDDRVPVAPHAPLTTEAEFTITIEPWVTGASYTEEI